MSMLFGILAFAAKPDFNENSVTPTWVGFAATFGVAIVTILIIIDMTRRIRRVRYRGEIREQLEAEQATGASKGPSGKD
ncbi:MAG: hypothetical protein JWO10_1700 [Microbacteriaceae bacterium]|nr:hypothetical protein [Microbacteriaceae bacterium]